MLASWEGEKSRRSEVKKVRRSEVKKMVSGVRFQVSA
jgi:hypothetical protein